MVRRLGMLADEVEIVFVRAHLRAGKALGQDIWLQGGLGQNFLRQLQAANGHFTVKRILQVVGVNQRRFLRIVTLQPDRSARPWAQIAGIERDPPLRHRHHAMLDPGAKAEVKLDVR